jgi:hypothetical protein
MTRLIPARALAMSLFTLSPLPAEAAEFACGDVIGPAKETVVVDNDMFDCAGAALTIVGPVTVDLGNSFIVCDPDQSAGGLVIEGHHAKVTGGHVDDCSAGVLLHGRDHRISRVDLNDNFIGVLVEQADRNRVEELDIENAELGIIVRAGTERNTFVDNRLRGIGFIGVQVEGGERHRFDGNKIDDSDAAGFSVLGSRHALVGNTARSDEIAFIVKGSDHTVVENSALFSGDGKGLNDGTGFVISGRKISLKENVARRNLGTGFRLEDVELLKADKNRAESNGKNGFVLIDAVKTELKRNVAFSNFNGHGIQVTSTGNRQLVMRQNTSQRHAAPFQDIIDDQGCAHTEWIDNEFERGSPSCVQ